MEIPYTSRPRPKNGQPSFVWTNLRVLQGLFSHYTWRTLADGPFRKFYLFYPPCKGWLRNLTQHLFHNVSSYSFARRAPAFPLVKMLFLTGEGFAWWSSRPLSVYSIFFIIGGDIRAGRGSFLLCSTELLLQIIILSLHDFIIISLMGYVTFPLKTASTHVDGMHTAFLIVLTISFTFKIEKLILLTNISRFRLMRACLMWIWSCYA